MLKALVYHVSETEAVSVSVSLQFSRPSTLKSQYRSYLDYVRLIGENMGFVVEEDTLRIPSSKRVGLCS